ncbi:hypothetical protein AAC387_Pa01g1806 [Persea americana]
MNQRATANNATTDRKRKRKRQPTSMTALNSSQQEDQAIDKLHAKSKTTQDGIIAFCGLLLDTSRKAPFTPSRLHKPGNKRRHAWRASSCAWLSIIEHSCLPGEDLEDIVHVCIMIEAQVAMLEWESPA